MTTSTNFNIVSNLTMFLIEKTGSVLCCWSGKLTANEQRALFGQAIGRGTIMIDGAEEIIFNRVKVCFGLDYDDRNVIRWNAL